MRRCSTSAASTVAASVTYVTEWSEYGHYGFSHVRIRRVETTHGWMFRHEWKPTGIGPVEIESWIPTSYAPDSTYHHAGAV